MEAQNARKKITNVLTQKTKAKGDNGGPGVFLLLARAPIPMLSLCGHRQSDERPLRAECVEKVLFR
jgi:hypothetical protein